jgi:hypothetical protein
MAASCRSSPNQHHLGLGLLGVIEEAGQLAAAQHAGLIHH